MDRQAQPRPARATALALLALLATGPAAAWTPESQKVIAAEAARLAPPDLARQLDKHARQLAAGAVEPFRDGDPARHFKNEDGSGQLDRVIAVEVENAVRAIESFRPFSEIAFRLGVVAHYVADANNPLNTSAADSREAAYFTDYLRYAESAMPRFPLIFYGLPPEVAEPSRGIGSLVERSLRRGRELYPRVGAEYRRVGWAPGEAAFDDRSTAFAVASLSFSRAVTDVALAMRQIWIAGGGADFRRGLPKQGERLVQLPRADAER